MEKITGSSGAISQNQKRSSLAVGGFIVMALLGSALVSPSLPGSVRVQAGSEVSYRQATFSAGSSPSAAKVGDLDGDGLNDIAVVNLQGSLQLFFNNGAGSFTRVSMNGLWPASSSTLDVDIGDLNSDGRNDIAVAFSTQNGSASVLLNQGSRAFAAPTNYSLCNSSSGVAIGDLDQDGDNDLADISQCSKSGILLNGGHGNLVFSGTYGAGDKSRAISLADFNRDGFKDIVYVNSGMSSVTVLINNRNASFGPTMWLYGGGIPNDVTAGDFNGDGGTDIAIADPYLSQIFILFNAGDGKFDAGYSEIAAGDTPSRIASGDFNGDGLLDLAVTSWGTGLLSILTSLNAYDYSWPRSFYVGQNPADVEVGNLDGDSLPDLVTVNQGSGSVTVLFSTGATTPPPPPPSQITLTASTRSTKKGMLVDLKWSGATGSSVDIYRNGSRIATVSNSGSYSDQFGARSKGTYTYKVCAAGTQQCSGDVAVSF